MPRRAPNRTSKRAGSTHSDRQASHSGHSAASPHAVRDRSAESPMRTELQRYNAAHRVVISAAVVDRVERVAPLAHYMAAKERSRNES